MAELGPHDIGNLLKCFQDALSLDKQVQKQAEALLQALSDRPGFCACLAVRSAPMLQLLRQNVFG